jgi:thiol-disulfide isomerase/thioredoxin
MKTVLYSLVLIALFACPAALAHASAREGEMAPDFSLASLTDGGRSVSLHDLRGKVVLVNFWASWCSSCKAEMPGLAGLMGEFGPRGFEFAPVNVDKYESRAIEFLDGLGGSLGPDALIPALYDRGGKAVRAFNPRGMPTSYLIDRGGLILKVYIGSFDDKGLAALRADIEEALER